MSRKGRGSRMDLQNKQKNLTNSKAHLEQVEKDADRNVESKRYWADKEEGYLERMRNGYSEGSKLYYDSFRTRATLTTGSILVILALSNSVLSINPTYSWLIWIPFVLLGISMVSSLKAMDLVTASVFSTLTNEEAPTRIRDGVEQLDEEALSKKLDEQNKGLSSSSRLASGSFLSGIGSFVLYAAFPPLNALIGIVLSIAILVTAAGAAVALYKKL